MMKRFLGAICLLVTSFLMGSCDNSGDNMKAMSAMRDSVFAAYPDINSVVLNVNGGTDLQIAVGSKTLFSAPDADRKARAAALASMAQRIFGEKVHLRSGRLLVTQDEGNQLPEPEGAVIEKLEFPDQH